MTFHIKSVGLLATRHTSLILLVAILLGACAQSPEDIAPAYISEMQFKDWNCEQLAKEKGQLAMALTTASAQQQQARDNDIAGVILLGLPVASISGSNIAPQVARLKGERDAVDQVLILKDCTGTVAAKNSSVPAASQETAALEPKAPASGPVTQTALLAVPPVSSIVVDKTQVENDDQLKSMISKHFKGLRFIFKTKYVLEIHSFQDLSVISISETTFIVDIKYRTSTDQGYGKYENATVEIEKTTDSYKIISFDRKK